MSIIRPRPAVIAAFCLCLAGGDAGAQAPTPQLPPPTFGTQRDGGPDVADTAARLADGMRGCAVRTDVAERLHCFDDLSHTLPMAGSSEAAREQARRGGWVQETRRDGTPVVGLSAVTVDSDADGDAWRHSHVFLFVRCVRGETDIYFALADQVTERAGDPVGVALRYDGDQGPVETWISSVNSTAVGLWGNDRAERMVGRLLRVRRLAVRINLPKDRALFAQFDLQGMTESLAPLRSACRAGW